MAINPTSPYFIPDDKVYTLNFSGGRSSGYMLKHILDAHGGTLPDYIKPVFANTGKEYPQSLDFVHACETHWNVPITWLEYRFDSTAKGGRKQPKHTYAIVNYDTASRNGEPFEQMIKSNGYLPSMSQRICTKELKINTITRYMLREHNLFNKHYHRLIGIRYDEPKRWGKAIYEECDLVYPMVTAKATKRDVNEYWKNSDFDLAFDYNSIRGNCDLCYLKGISRLRQIIKEEPDRAAWWIKQEQYRKSLPRWNKDGKGSETVFMRGTTYQELHQDVLQDRQVEMEFDIQSEVDCYCGD